VSIDVHGTAELAARCLPAVVTWHMAMRTGPQTPDALAADAVDMARAIDRAAEAIAAEQHMPAIAAGDVPPATVHQVRHRLSSIIRPHASWLREHGIGVVSLYVPEDARRAITITASPRAVGT